MIDPTIQTTDRVVIQDLNWEGVPPDMQRGKVQALFVLLQPPGEKIDYAKPPKELRATAFCDQDTFIALKAVVYKDEGLGRPPILSVDHIGRRLVGWRNMDTGEEWKVK